jgi:hypothetical protein
MAGLARTARRQAKRKKDRAGPIVTLVNPVSDHFPAFIVGNAATWQVRALVEIQEHMEPDAYEALCREFQSYKVGTAFASSQAVHDTLNEFATRYVVQEGEATGQTLVLCGAGPSLREHAAEYVPQADQVWGCNSAATWLANNGHRVTHAFTVDQTPHMVEEWADVPDVEYLLATTIHPNLAEHLVEHDRRFRYFHNFVGIQNKPVEWEDWDGELKTMPYEHWMYAAMFPTTTCCGSGLNSVTRAIDLAHFMGFERIYVLGADCSLRFTGEIPETWGTPEQRVAWLKTHTTMHADGGHALASEATPITMHAQIDGRMWLTKPDMAISAQWLAKMAQKNPATLTLVGDTLPNAILGAKEVWNHRTGKLESVSDHDVTWLPNFVDHQGKLANIPV